MRVKQGLMQIGKNGLKDSFIESLRESFKTHENIKITVLKSAGHDKKKVKEMAEEIIEKLGKNYTQRVVGFTIFVKRWRRAIRD